MKKTLEQALLVTQIKNIFKEVDAVIFDFDFTLWFHDKSEIHYICNKLGISDSPLIASQYRLMLESFFTYLKGLKISKKLVADYIEYKMPILGVFNISGDHFLNTWNNVDATIANPDALELLQLLSGTLHLPLYGLSDWFKETQTSLLKKYGYFDFFKEIYCFDDHFLKSEPETSAFILEELKEHKNVIIIGDSLAADIVFAHNAGYQSILLSTKPVNGTTLEPTCIVPSLSVITNALKDSFF